jgi:hypothetical protein
MSTLLLILLLSFGLLVFSVTFGILSAIRLGKECDRIANSIHAENRKELP